MAKRPSFVQFLEALKINSLSIVSPLSSSASMYIVLSCQNSSIFALPSQSSECILYLADRYIQLVPRELSKEADAFSKLPYRVLNSIVIAQENPNIYIYIQGRNMQHFLQQILRRYESQKVNHQLMSNFVTTQTHGVYCPLWPPTASQICPVGYNIHRVQKCVSC